MYSFLDVLGEEELRAYVEGRVPGIDESVVMDADRERLYDVLFALDGYDVLYDERIRHRLLNTLERSEINELLEEFGRSKAGKKYDAIVKLRNIPWRVGDRFPRVFGRIFSVPETYLPSRRREVRDRVVIDPYSEPPPLFEYQREVVEELDGILQGSGEERGGLVQLPTGAGKTRITQEALFRWRNETLESNRPSGVLWLAHSEELCEQAFESFCGMAQARSEEQVSVTRLWGTHAPDIREGDEGIVVSSYQKMHSLKRKDYERFQDCVAGVQVVVVDEAHKSLAPTLLDLLGAIGELESSVTIGLSATPGRGVESALANRRLASLFENNLVTAESLGPRPLEELQSRGVLSRIERKVLKSDYWIDASDSSEDTREGSVGKSTLRELARDEERNRVIMNRIEEECEAGHSALIFACTVDHARQLAVKCSGNGIPSASIHYNMRYGQRRKLIRAFRKGRVSAMFNFGVLSAGFDAPNVEALFITRPTGSVVLYSQMIGRGMRGARVGGTKKCRVYDVVDNYEGYADVDNVYGYFHEYWS